MKNALLCVLIVCAYGSKVMFIGDIKEDAGVKFYGKNPPVSSAGSSLFSIKHFSSATSNDLVIGTYSEQTYIIPSTRATPWPVNVSLDTIANDGGYLILASTNMTTSVSNAFDINNDGFDDLIITTYRQNHNGAAFCIVPASSYIIFGGDLSSKHEYQVSEFDDGTKGFHVINSAVTDCYIYSFGVGDINGDGINDIAFGTDISDNDYRGILYILFGHSGAFAPTIDLKALTSEQGFSISGTTANPIGRSKIKGFIDVNNDGVSDLIIGGNTIYVVFGSKDINKKTIILDKLDGSDGFIFDNIGSTGHISVLGDINNDGASDIGIGNNNIYVVFGGKKVWDSHFDLKKLDGTNGFLLIGPERGETGANSGGSDFNGDGIIDMVIGSPDASYMQKCPGEAFIVFGRKTWPSTVNLTTMSEEEGTILIGEGTGRDSYNEFGAVVSDAHLKGNDIAIAAVYASDDGGSVYILWGAKENPKPNNPNHLVLVICCSVGGGLILISGVIIVSVLIYKRKNKQQTKVDENDPLVQANH